MNPHEIDLILAGEEDILPSSGFVASVMEALHREASAPPPIPFPWRRAWPGLVAGALTLVLVPAALLGVLRHAVASGAPPPVPASAIASLLRPAIAAGAHWAALGLLVTVVSILFAKRVAGGRAS